MIFSRVGEVYVRSLQGEIGPEEVLATPNLNRIIRRVKKKRPFIDESLFRSAVVAFFSDADPDYIAIKWNMAQNFYVAKAIGLDPSGQLLSADIFGNSVFYLDTNVIVAALEPKSPHHESFKNRFQNVAYTSNGLERTLAQSKNATSSAAGDRLSM